MITNLKGKLINEEMGEENKSRIVKQRNQLINENQGYKFKEVS